MNSALKFFSYAVPAALCAVFMFSCSDRKSQNDAAIIVNGHTVTQEHINQAAMFFRMQQAQARPEKVFDGVENENELRKGAARQLAANILMIEDVKSRQWRADSAIIELMVNRFTSQFKDRGEFLAQLKAMGESEESMRSGIEEELLLDSLMNTVSRLKDSINEQECRALYDENKSLYTSGGRVRASHIVFTLDFSADSAQVWNTMAKAREVQARAKAGENFDMLVKTYSSQPLNADMGWFGAGELIPDLESALFSLKKGEISDLVPSSMGIHILRKTDEEPPRALAYEEAAERIRKTIELTKMSRQVNSYIDSLLAAADIIYIDRSLVPGVEEKSAELRTQNSE
ncbi:MAG: peptidyl-prolyl cis-trans isomerase [Chitinispirillales bacterium]|jgi:parvulin-like peptidyl-prolyl isomerase|nr:peptidyl-prolyl cis-trans isomerase [Chitinispirillales bacterium]